MIDTYIVIMVEWIVAKRIEFGSQPTNEEKNRT